jgi:nucleotide-binding universal stress UspA family protein
MYTTIIWATDGSDEADAALHEVRRLAELGDGHVFAVHCDRLLTGRASAYSALADEDDVRKKVHRQVEELKSDGLDIDYLIRRSHRDAAEVVAAIADELDADVIVCGAHGHGAFSGAFHGSFAHHLLRVAPCPVLAIPKSRAHVQTTQQTSMPVHA